jgi:hypothetical protein
MKVKRLVILIVLTISIISLLIYSCKKKDPVFYISQLSKDYCYYKSGSYWIYKNDSTGLFDSIFTNTDPSQVILERGGYKEEIIDVSLRGGFLTDYYIGHQCSSDHRINYTEGDDRVELGLAEPDTLHILAFSIWPDQTFNSVQHDPCDYAYNDTIYFKSEILTSYSYFGIVFNNVLHTNYRSADTTNSNPNAVSYHYYFVKHIGLIHLIETSALHHFHRSFGLIRWSIKQ